MTFADLAGRARHELERAGISARTAALDAEILARHVLLWDRATWVAHRRDPADESFVVRYRAIIARRLTREPVAYIRGVQEFWGREFHVSRAVLIPRAETELIVEVALGWLRDRPAASVVDVGTGSGCIAVTLALECPLARIDATDTSADAIAVARENAARLGANQVRFHVGEYLADAPRPIDLIVSNPPYVAGRDRRALAPEVGVYEPSEALFGGEDGLDAIRAVLDRCRDALAPDGRLIMEIGHGQADGVEEEVGARPGLALDEIHPDLVGIPRVAVIRRTQPA